MSTLHLIYIHGFQGTDKSFQAFPTDLQHYLQSQVISLSGITIKSTIYPTYKSSKPLSYATKNFLEWLSTQIPGRVILFGHSMGGLLAAEAALDPSNNPRLNPTRYHPIIGLITLDCPFLGLHPHVIKSGIASLFSKDSDKNAKMEDPRPNPPHSESELNPHVEIVDHRVTDGWEEFKKGITIPLKHKMPSPQNSSSSSRKLFSHSSTSTSRSTSTSTTSTSSWSSTLFSSLVSYALPYIEERYSTDPRYKWLQKHSSASSIKRWLIERFQFGSCMFDPHGLKERYETLVAWKDGDWINYWTHVPKRKRKHNGEHKDENNHGHTRSHSDPNSNSWSNSSETGSLHSFSSSSTSSSAELQTFIGDSTGAEHKFYSHHFSLLPTTRVLSPHLNLSFSSSSSSSSSPSSAPATFGGAEHWEGVLIMGAKDEVEAHCGIFIRAQNLEYDAFVERVGKKVLSWV